LRCSGRKGTGGFEGFGSAGRRRTVGRLDLRASAASAALDQHRPDQSDKVTVWAGQIEPPLAAMGSAAVVIFAVFRSAAGWLAA
jgi:hypothetical protein